MGDLARDSSLICKDPSSGTFVISGDQQAILRDVFMKNCGRGQAVDRPTFVKILDEASSQFKLAALDTLLANRPEYEVQQFQSSFLFDLFDTDNSGAVDFEEFQAGIQAFAENDPDPSRQAQLLFRSIDCNNDGFVVKDELQAWVENQLKWALRLALAIVHEGQRKPALAQLIMSCALRQAETMKNITAQLLQYIPFDSIDEDNNGKIDPDEFARWHSNSMTSLVQFWNQVTNSADTLAATADKVASQNWVGWWRDIQNGHDVYLDPDGQVTFSNNPTKFPVTSLHGVLNLNGYELSEEDSTALILRWEYKGTDPQQAGTAPLALWYKQPSALAEYEGTWESWLDRDIAGHPVGVEEADTLAAAVADKQGVVTFRGTRPSDVNLPPTPLRAAGASWFLGSYVLEPSSYAEDPNTMVWTYTGSHFPPHDMFWRKISNRVMA